MNNIAVLVKINGRQKVGFIVVNNVCFLIREHIRNNIGNTVSNNVWNNVWNNVRDNFIDMSVSDAQLNKCYDKVSL